MIFTHCSDYEEMSIRAARQVLHEVKANKNLLLCTATGNSPKGLYSELVKNCIQYPILFQQIRILKLDEWGGLPENDCATCEYYLERNLLEPLKIPSDRYISFRSNPADPIKECERIQSKLKEKGPIDVCILGLGRNGHLGLNEPAPSLQLYCHVAELSKKSLQHSMIKQLVSSPKYGMTLGMKEILNSGEIILLVWGDSKSEIAKKLLQKNISTYLPASLLWIHDFVECFIDRETVSV